jgi:acyl carrier protein
LPVDSLEMVYNALDETDAQSLTGAPVAKTTEAPLLGSDQGVDSLTIVNLVVAIEEQIQKRTGKTIVLVDEDSMALQEHPFRTVGTLAAYVEKLIQKHA